MLNKKVESYVPTVAKEKKLEFNCPVKSLVSTDHYRIDIDHDPCNGVVYLNVGYDNDEEFDSPIYLNPDDAIDLAEKLYQYGKQASRNVINGLKSRHFIQDLERDIKNKNIKWLSIYPYTLADQSYFTGCMLLEIKYFRLDDKSNTCHSCRLLSDNYLKNKDIRHNEDFKNKLLNDYEIETVRLHEYQFDKLYNQILDRFKVDPVLYDESIKKSLEELQSYQNNNIIEE